MERGVFTARLGPLRCGVLYRAKNGGAQRDQGQIATDVLNITSTRLHSGRWVAPVAPLSDGRTPQTGPMPLVSIL